MSYFAKMSWSHDLSALKMKIRNAACEGTQTSKVPPRVTLLFIFYFVVIAEKCKRRHAFARKLSEKVVTQISHLLGLYILHQV